jgi:hypothetical protein
MRLNGKRLLYLVLIVATFCFVYSLAKLWQREANVSVNAVVFLPAHVDCGTIVAGTPHEFELKCFNGTDALIEIEDMVESCGCVSLSADKTTLGIGETATVTGRWDTGSAVGPVQASVSVVYSSRHTSSSRVVGATLVGYASSIDGGSRESVAIGGGAVSANPLHPIPTYTPSVQADRSSLAPPGAKPVAVGQAESPSLIGAAELSAQDGSGYNVAPPPVGRSVLRQ